MPFQNNFNFDTGPDGKTVYNLNFQPVIPIHVTEHWNLITRTIVPILNVPSLAPGLDDEFGMGDINPTVFLSPSGSKKFIWGGAPVMTSNWKADAGQRWVVPVGGGAGKVFRLGKLPINTQIQGFYNAVRPDEYSKVQLRFQFQFLFPQ